MMRMGEPSSWGWKLSWQGLKHTHLSWNKDKNGQLEKKKKKREKERKDRVSCSKVSKKKKISRWERKGLVGGWRVLGRLGSVGPWNDTAKSVLQSSRWQCHHSCSEVCVCGVLVHFIVFLLCVHEMRNNTNVRILCTGVFGGILLSCACVCMCLCLCMRACLWD